MTANFNVTLPSPDTLSLHFVNLMIEYGLNTQAQERVNQIHPISPITKGDIAGLAEGQHAQFPQYRNHWSGDEWILVRLKRQVRSKAGLAFLPGDTTLGKRSYCLGEWICYSIRNSIDTQVSYGVEPL